MPLPARATTAEAQTSLLADWVRSAYDDGLTDGAGVVANLQTMQANYNGPDDRAPHAGIANGLQQYGNAIKTTGLRLLWEWIYSPSIAAPRHLVMREAMQWARDYLMDEGAFAGGSVDAYVTSSDWTRASEPTLAGATVISTTTDRRGQARQNGHAQALRLRVSTDGATLQKKVTISGAPRGQEPFEMLGSDRSIEITLFDVQAKNDGGGQKQILDNPVLRAQTITDATQVTSINGWTLSATCDWYVESSANVFGRQASVLYTGSTTAANFTLTQQITKGLSKSNPHAVGFWARNRSSMMGTFQIAWGDVSQAWTESSFSGTDWTPFIIDRDKDMYVQNFDEDELDLVWSITTFTSGEMELGSIFMIEMKEAPETGRHLALLTNDTGPLHEVTTTLTDSRGGSEGDISQCFNVFFDESLPVTGTIAIADPS